MSIPVPHLQIKGHPVDLNKNTYQVYSDDSSMSLFIIIYQPRLIQGIGMYSKATPQRRGSIVIIVLPSSLLTYLRANHNLLQVCSHSKHTYLSNINQVNHIANKVEMKLYI